MKNNIKKLISIKDKKFYPLMIFTLAVSILMFFSYNYMDLKSLTVWSLNLLDCVWEGKLYDYYAYNAENVYHLVHDYMGSNYIPLIPWAIWNIPIWILQRWFGIAAVEHAWTLLYSKLFLAAVWLLTVYFSYKMLRAATGEKGEKYVETLYLILSCPMAMIAVYYTGQSDIISICLFAVAVYKLMQGKQKSFYIFSALSIGAKPYIILAYFAVLLLIEKNICKIAVKTFGGGQFSYCF